MKEITFYLVEIYSEELDEYYSCYYFADSPSHALELAKNEWECKHIERISSISVSSRTLCAQFPGD